MTVLGQIAIYELLDIVPFALLVIAPLKVYLRSKRAQWLAIGALYCVGIMRRYVVLQMPAAILFPTFPLAYRVLTKMVAPLIASDENAPMWNYLWLVPATFCIFFYFNLYVGNGILGFSQHTKNVVFAIVIGAGSFFVMILVLQLVRESNLTLHLQAQNHQLSLDTLRYQSMKERMDEARRARHDLRQCMAALQGFLQNGDAEGLRSYVQQVCEAIPPDAPHVRCGHPAVDALFGYYEGQAAAQKTEFSIQTDDLRPMEMQDTDLIVLLGNLLENAVEACARQKAGGRFIRLRVREQGHAWIITLDNSCDEPLLRDESGCIPPNGPEMALGLCPSSGLCASIMAWRISKATGRSSAYRCCCNPIR